MSSIATLLRALQFLAHRAHNVIKGPTFFEDHKFLGKLYPDYEAAYDDIIQSKYHLLLKDKQTFESQLKSDWNDSRSQITAMKNSNSMLIAENARLQ